MSVTLGFAPLKAIALSLMVDAAGRGAHTALDGADADRLMADTDERVRSAANRWAK